MPLVMIYNWFLQNITKTITKNWNILRVNKNLKKIFKNEPITAFKQNKNIQEIIGTHWIDNGRIKKDLKTLKEGNCTLWRSKAGNVCCKQVKTTTTFKSQQTNKTWKIFHNTICKTEYAIYLLECIICNLQYVRKNETPFNIRLKNYREDVKDPKAILADKYFQKNGHRFNGHTRFTIIDGSTNTNLDKEILRECFIQRENFWIQKLETL